MVLDQSLYTGANTQTEMKNGQKKKDNVLVKKDLEENMNVSLLHLMKHLLMV